MLKAIKRFLFSHLLMSSKDLLDAYILSEYKVYGSRKGIYISPKSNVNNGLFNAASGNITIKDYTFFGHNVSIIAATHDITKFGEERMSSIPDSGYDIVINEGVWIGSNSVIIGPCNIGRNAVIAAGSVVIGDVGEFDLFGGVPAKFIKNLK